MKNLFLIIILVAATFLGKAQAPNSIPYQAVVRSSDGSPMASTTVTLTFGIHNLSAAGDVVYQETQSTTTNTQGLVSLNIGAGNPVTGSFSTINWGSGAKFLQVAMNAGSGNIDLGTQQMMSVPYTLYAENTVVKISNSGDTLTIGGNSVIVPGISLANPVSISNYGSVLLPGVDLCPTEYISVTGCGGQDSLLYYDRYYSLVEIGGQCWFGESLSTNNFNNGDLISINQYSLNQYQAEVFLYNPSVIEDIRNVCPSGFHVATLCDYHFLFMSQGSSVEQLNSAVPLFLPSLNSLWADGNNSSGFNLLNDYWIWGAEIPTARILTRYNQIPAGIGTSSAEWFSSPSYDFINGQIRCIKD